jgi:chromosome segregation ATPase
MQGDHADALEAERTRVMADLQSALEAERSRHEEQLRAAEDRSHQKDQLVERLKAEILAIAQSRSSPDADLEAAQLEIADLRRKLADTETSKRSMSSLLEGMGIRLH